MSTTLFKGLNRAAGLVKQAKLSRFQQMIIGLKNPGKVSSVGKAGRSVARGKALQALPDGDTPRQLQIIDDPHIKDLQSATRNKTLEEFNKIWGDLYKKGYRFGKGGLQRTRSTANSKGELMELVDEATLRNILAQDKNSWAGKLLEDARKANIMGDKLPSFTKALAEVARRARRTANKTAAKPLTRYKMPKNVNTSKLTSEELKNYSMYGPSSLGAPHNKLRQKIQKRLSGQGKPKNPKAPVKAPGAEGADDVAELSLSQAIAQHPWLALGGTGLASGGAGYALASSGAPDEAEIARRIAAAQASNPTAADLQAYYNY